jgi:hypothetical protein
MAFLRLLICFSVVASRLAAPVVISGATGQTGSLTYNLLKSRNIPVRALIRNATKAKDVLGCTKCDESEGIFVGDVTKPETLTKAMDGAGALVILTGASPTCNPFPNCHYPKGAYPIDVDFHGGKNQIEAFLKGAGALKPVILVTSMGTTEPDSMLDKMGKGELLFYKLNLESFLMSSGAPFTIVKPCGLGSGKPLKDELIVGHEDAEGWPMKTPIQRADVARVVAEAAEKQPESNLRFDLCAKAGSPTLDADIPALLKAAGYPWQQFNTEV